MIRTLPAKTFLCGEYVALHGGPAIVLTTTPCFTLHSAEPGTPTGIHPESPAGRYLADYPNVGHVQFIDPYGGMGGLGASSAQFVGVHQAVCERLGHPTSEEYLLQQYLAYAWRGKGIRPSGYDVIAQTRSDCVCIERNNHHTESCPWPFEGLGFVMIHTGQKLQTHVHLETLSHRANLTLHHAASAVMEDFVTSQEARMITSLQQFQHALTEAGLTTRHSQSLLEQFGKRPDVLAAKACGAMGADIIVLLTARETEESLQNALGSEGWQLIATSRNLHTLP